MKKEDLQETLEAISKSGIKVAGDLVLEKKVEYEVANVEAGGIGGVFLGKQFLCCFVLSAKGRAEERDVAVSL